MSDQFTLHPQLLADTVEVADLPLCALRLMDCKALPWLILIPRRNAISEIIDLAEADQAELLIEIRQVSKLIRAEFDPRKINVAALGNVVPQLHVHIIARSESDPAWPKPIWGNVPMVAYAGDERVARVAQIRAALALS